MRKPVVFLSSTIVDFHDLRSALRHFLEQQGCVVLASEYNDFPKPLDHHVMDACLATIHQADFFVLLIGTRVGAWYDPSNRISVTRREYREAYNLHRRGSLKLISFVREDVWRLREDRRELRSFLETTGLDPATQSQIVNYPSSRAADAEVISDFISEVCRERETSTAKATGAEPPTANWLHPFREFVDIVDVIRTQVFRGRITEHAPLRRLLIRELHEIVRTSLVKFAPGSIVSPRTVMLAFREAHRFDLASRDLDVIELDPKLWDLLSSVAYQLLLVNPPNVILERALESSAFLSFDPATLTYREDPVYDALARLSREIQKFRECNTTETKTVLVEYSPRNRGGRAAPVRIPPLELFGLLHLMDRWINIIEIARAVARHIEGRDLVIPSLRPDSPLDGMDEQMRVEQLSPEEVRAFLDLDR